MFISEIFYSVQGEGIYTGTPSVFIRTGGCNLRCRWCDTKYALWEAVGKEITIEKIVETASGYPTRFYVITGGEPMLDQDIHDLCKQLSDYGKHITIETAATLPPKGITCSLASLSPKLSNSIPGDDVPVALRHQHERTRLNPDVIRAWLDQYEYQLKFVICSDSDIAEMLGLLMHLDRTIPSDRVLLMPEGVDSSALDESTNIIISACKKYGFRFCDRLHIRLFGNKRGY